MHYLSHHKDSNSAAFVNLTGLSRQRVAKILSQLIREGKIIRSGSTKNARYRLAVSPSEIPKPQELVLLRALAGLEEDRVFDECDLRLRLKKTLRENVYRIIYYAFTEMLNNAIDHSCATQVKIRFCIENNLLHFHIRDHGVGVFANIQKKFQLDNEFTALEHLLKGKQTTAPAHHTGQGIFFTSRIADKFSLRSHKLELIIDNERNDIFVAERRNFKGTEVYFEIRKRTHKILKDVFDQFSNEEYEFDRTHFKVKLSARHDYLSRSQAKRILFGLEKFDKIVFDFTGVAMIGQSFADEIFRVHQKHNPHQEITFCNANEAVTQMILRAIRN